MPGTLVSFHAHPDDEAILVGGTLALAAEAGHRVVLVFATRGDLGEVADGVLVPTSSSPNVANKRRATPPTSSARRAWSSSRITTPGWPASPPTTRPAPSR